MAMPFIDLTRGLRQSEGKSRPLLALGRFAGSTRGAWLGSACSALDADRGGAVGHGEDAADGESGAGENTRTTVENGSQRIYADDQGSGLHQ